MEELQGAPADAVISALGALQRILHLIGMKDEGRVFGQRVKPSAKVRKEYAIICKVPEIGSHIQPFSVRSLSSEGAGAFLARDRLLNILKSFDSGNADTVLQAIPDPRERWFFADAAAGLVPDPKSGLEITIRPGSHGPFSFKAERARTLIESMRSGKPPTGNSQRLLCKLRGVTFDKNVAWLGPTEGPSFRISYPSIIEPMLQSNARKRLFISGVPSVNATGDISGFDTLESVSEFESTAKVISEVYWKDNHYVTSKPLRIPVTFNNEDKLFTFQNEGLGLDVYSDTYESIMQEVYREIDLVWRNYASASDIDLADDALTVKKNFNDRFKVVSDAAQ